MADAIPDLWPDIEQTQVVPPIAILRQQAAALAKKTNYLLQGQVETITTSGGRFTHSFNVVAPSLDNYTYKLFWIEHGAEQYPVVAPTPETGLSTRPLPRTLTIESQDDLLDYIREVLNSDKTKKIVSSLLAQVKATT
jgi:hypothetical protein